MKNALLFSLSCLLCLVFAELAVRIYLFGPAAFSYSELRSFQTFGHSGLLQPSKHPEVAFELKPNISRRQMMVEVSTNRWGQRDKDYTKKKPPGVFRVAVVGDSFTAAPAVPIESTYHSLLEERLNRTGKGEFEVINFAVAGYYFRQTVATIKEKVLEFEPDLVLIGYCAANDHDVPPENLFSVPYKVKEFKNGFFSSYLVRLVKYTWSAFLQGDDAARTHAPEERLYLNEQFERLRVMQEESGIPFVVVFLNNYPVDSSAVAELSAASGLRFIDTSKDFSREELSEVSIFLIDRHPNEQAHRRFAERILSELQLMKLL